MSNSLLYADMGCKLPNGQVYKIDPIFGSILSGDAKLSFCPNTSTTTTILRNITKTTTTPCLVLLAGGVYVEYTELNCPLDNYAFAFSSIFGLLGFIYIRKMKL
ncbi:hypothetical protein [Pedobacter mucosus]|uniref:hypothetical protein n=1 Tax=Pedobacter mucosus TaxID=2895286 RepID=UPI001EE3B4A5|nr:hypothetical protein [Pedobacter mucosus]UKT64413.1 hypothetical protein LOK61_01235 [Pedobacter mucosus]